MGGVIVVIGLLFVLIAAGIIFAIGGSILNIVADETYPVFQELGVVGSTNATQAVELTLGPVNTVIQNFTWFGGLLYIMGLMGIFGLAFAYKLTANKWMVGFFFVVLFMMVISAIILSNIYEDFYDGDDEIADGLHEQALLSFLIIYSPMLISVLGFIAGIVLFSGSTEEFV